MNLYLEIYLIGAGISGLVTADAWIMNNETIEGIDSCWDWVVYNLLWGVQLIKALWKFIKHLICAK